MAHVTNFQANFLFLRRHKWAIQSETLSMAHFRSDQVYLVYHLSSWSDLEFTWSDLI